MMNEGCWFDAPIQHWYKITKIVLHIPLQHVPSNCCRCQAPLLRLPWATAESTNEAGKFHLLRLCQHCTKVAEASMAGHSEHEQAPRSRLILLPEAADQ